jgi:hypothetical protein
MNVIRLKEELDLLKKDTTEKKKQIQKIQSMLKSEEIDSDPNVVKKWVTINKLLENGKNTDAIKEVLKLADYATRFLGDNSVNVVNTLDGTLDYAINKEPPIKIPYKDRIDIYVRPKLYGIIGGGTGVGKTTNMLNQAYCSSLDGKISYIYSIEMDAAELIFKLFTIHLYYTEDQGVDTMFIQNTLRNNVSGFRDKFKKFHKQIVENKIRILELKDYTPNNIYKSHLFVESEYSETANFVFIDHFHLLKCDDPKLSRDDKVHYYSAIADDIRENVKKTNSAYIILTQMSQDDLRLNEKTGEPFNCRDATGFKYTGELPMHAAFSIKLYRAKNETDTLDAYIVKNRFGKLGETKLKFNMTSGALL